MPRCIFYDIEETTSTLWVYANVPEFPLDGDVCTVVPGRPALNTCPSEVFCFSLKAQSGPQSFFRFFCNLNFQNKCFSIFNLGLCGSLMKQELGEAQMFGSKSTPVNSQQKNAWLAQRNMEYLSSLIKYNHMLLGWTSLHSHSQYRHSTWEIPCEVGERFSPFYCPDR